MEVLNWFAKHWHTLLESVGIIGLVFTAVSFRKDAQARKVENLLKFTQAHRDLWSQLYSSPQLRRVLDKNVDLDAAPITAEEEMFLGFVLLHLKSAYRAARAGVFVLPEAIGDDIRSFFSLPIPRATWEKLKKNHDRDFVRFVEEHQSNESPRELDASITRQRL